MTNQEKIQFLRQYRRIKDKIELLQQEIWSWRELGEKTTPSLTGMPKGGQDSSKVEQAAVMVCDTESQIAERIVQLTALRQKIEQAIEAVEDINLQNLLHRRYIQGQTFEQIACEMHYSWQWVHNLHKRALNALQIPKS